MGCPLGDLPLQACLQEVSNPTHGSVIAWPLLLPPPELATEHSPLVTVAWILLRIATAVVSVHLKL